MGAARIAQAGLRLCFLINLVLGLYFWISGNDTLVGLHMLVGILFVIFLWAFSAIVGLQTGSVGFVAGCFVLGLLIAILGLTQTSIFSAIVGLQTGSVGFVAGCFVLGLLIAILGLTQTSILQGSGHWIVQVVHLLLAVIAIGFAEMYGARLRRGVQPTTA
jgi:hypothetical protein